jgi:hypothetical protein
MKKNYTEEDMLKVIQEVEAEFSSALAKAEAEIQSKEDVQETSSETDTSENFEKEVEDLYASMEKSEAEAHFKAISKVLGVENMSKSEESEESKLIKSENDELKKQNETLKKNLDQITAILTKMVKPSAPSRKAIVSEAEFIKKSEAETKTEEKDVKSLSKNEISQILTDKIRSGKLEKKDQDAIVSFYEGKSKIETIKHLL